MTKEQMIERYRKGYATDEHLNTAVARELLTVEEAESLKTERYNKGGIVKREELEQLKATIGDMEEVAVEAEYRLLLLEAAQEPTA